MSIAILFPGQGSQSVGMMKSLSERYPLVQQRFQEASEIVKRDLWDIAQNNPDDIINATEYTQPIVFTAGYVAYEILKTDTNVAPCFMAGHSLGEYTALAASGAFSFQEGVELVHIRGQLMQAAVPHGQGAMAAIIGLRPNIVSDLCAQVEGNVYPANFNSPEQVVIGGETEAVKKACEFCKEAGAKRALLLPVSVPSHTPLMRSAAAKLGLYLEKIHWKVPEIPVIFNYDAQTYKERYGIEAALGKQLYEPVQWLSCIDALHQKGIHKFIEVGPGKVLSGLVKRINKDCQTANFETPEQLDTVRTFIMEAV